MRSLIPTAALAMIVATGALMPVPAAALAVPRDREKLRELPSNWLDDDLGEQPGTPAEARRAEADQAQAATDQAKSDAAECRRAESGSTGMIVGAVAGGLLGRAIDGGRSSAVGTIIGAGGGALLGREVQRQAKCK